MNKKILTHKEIAAYCESLSIILGSGVSSEEAVIIICDSKDNKLEQISKLVRNNFEFSITEALKKSKAFPNFMVEMVEAGETSGKLEVVLKRLASYFDNISNTESKIKSAVMYPTIALCVLSLLLLVITLKVLPIFSDIYKGLSGEITTAGTVYMNLSFVIGWVVFGVTSLLTVVLFALWIMWKGKSTKKLVLKLFLLLPFTSSVLYEVELARFTSLYSTYISGAVNTEIAFENASKSITHKKLLEKLELCRRSIAVGNGFAKAAYECGLFLPLYGRVLLSSETAGRGKDGLMYITEKEWELTNEKINDTTSSIEPVLSAVVTVSVGVLLISVMLPLIGIMNSIG